MGEEFAQWEHLMAIKDFLPEQKQQGYLQSQIQIDVCVAGYNKLDKQQFSATIVVNAVEDWN